MSVYVYLLLYPCITISIYLLLYPCITISVYLLLYPCITTLVKVFYVRWLHVFLNRASCHFNSWIFAFFSLCPFLWSSIQPIFVYSSSTTSILFYHWTSWTLSIKWQYERFAFAKWKRGSKVLTYFLNGLSSASASFIFALFKQTIQIIQ